MLSDFVALSLLSDFETYDNELERVVARRVSVGSAIKIVKFFVGCPKGGWFFYLLPVGLAGDRSVAHGFGPFNSVIERRQGNIIQIVIRFEV